MLSKIYAPSRREDGISLTETVIAVVIIVLVLTATAYALTSAFGGTSSAQNFNKAYQLINKQFAIAKQVSFDKLGIVPADAATQVGQVQSLSYCNVDNSYDSPGSAGYATKHPYNRKLDIPGKQYESTNRTQNCLDSAANRTNVVCPTYTGGTYKDETRVEIPYSNSNVTGDFPNTGDPGTSQNASSPIYCAWYQFGQGNGEALYTTCDPGNSNTNCAAGGVGTIFTVETDVTWVNATNFDKQDSGASRDDSSSFTDCYGISANHNCFQAKRITVTVRWSESSPAGAVQRGVTSSFIRSPNISNCLPVGGNGFVANATPAPTPVPTTTSGVSGVSCGQG